MTEELETCDFEYSNENDLLEEEVDKLNDLTFGDEIACKYDNLNFENDDSNFERFPFDEFESNENEDVLSSNDRNINDNDNLLGLKGSFFNFGLFKSAQKGDDETSFNNNRDVEFEIAMGKLDLLDVEEDKSESLKKVSTTGLGFGDFNMLLLTELTKYSDSLYLQFQGFQKLPNNTPFLKDIVAKHLNLLSKKVTQLLLPLEVLTQLRYFRLLTVFVNADSHINDVRLRCADDPRRYNAILMQEFASQLPQQQTYLASIHPFYNDMLIYLCSQRQVPVTLGQQRQQGRQSHNYQSPISDFDLNDGGWMSESERDWLMKLQTRNLVTDNPYVHDYYYTVVTFKKMAVSRQAQLVTTGGTDIPDPISLLPSPITADQLGAGVDPTKDGLSPQYFPAQYANSLGTLTTSNLNTPRKTIDVPQRQRRPLPTTTITKSDSYGLVRAHRELLGIVESLYWTVLRIDEVDKSLVKVLVAQHRSRTMLLGYRRHLLRSLMATVTGGGQSLARIAAQEKGVSALASVVAAVDSTQFTELLVLLVRDVVVPRQHSLLLSNIESQTRGLAREDLSQLIAAFFDDPGTQTLSAFCRSQFGLHVVFTVLDAFLKLSPGDKSNISQLVNITLKFSDSKTVSQDFMHEFPLLFPTIVIDN